MMEEGLMTPRERALVISARGGQILLPFKAGDAAVSFPSRLELARQIAEAIRGEFDPGEGAR